MLSRQNSFTNTNKYNIFLDSKNISPNKKLEIMSHPKQNPRRFYLRIFFLRLLFFSLFIVFIASHNAQRLPVKTYSVADGLLRDSTVKIKQDSHGFLWFCTNDGVSRFDGYGFTNFTVADGLPERHAADFLETRDGTIWIATRNGLARLDKNAEPTKAIFTPVIPKIPQANIVNVLFEAKNGGVYAGTENGLYKIKENDEFEPVNLEAFPSNAGSLAVTSIIEDGRGALWIGTKNGLLKLLPDGKSEYFAKADGLPDTNITTLHEDKNNRIWIGLRPNFASGLCLLVENPQKNRNIVERFYTTNDGLPSVWITDLLTTANGKFWVATTSGLCLWEEGKNSVCKTYTSANDICDMESWTITEDKDENLWIGTRCGVKKIARYGFTTYDEPNGTKNSTVNSIFENASGGLFVSYNDGNIRTVSRFNGDDFENVRPNFPADIKYFGWGNRHTVRQDKSGDWWFPTASGLYKFSKPTDFKDLSETVPQKLSPNIEKTQIFRLFEDSQGNFWISGIKTVDDKTIYEFWLWNRKTNDWRNLTEPLNVSENRMIVSFAEDKSGSIWFGSDSENDQTTLIRYKNGNFKVFTQNGDEALTGHMMNLFADSKNRLWIANPIMGLLRLDDVNSEHLNFKRYTPAEGLSTIGILTVTEDDYGRIYVGTARGLDRLNAETGQIEHFTTADGLPSSFVETSLRDRQNNLWFGTEKGIARFVPEPQRTRIAPNIFIMGLQISGVSRPVSILGETAIQDIELNSSQRQISVDFLGLGANLGEKLKYEYRFENDEWTTTDERTINFANLASGEYKFEVLAVTADRIYSQNPATVSFRIAAPLWQRWWFLSLTALVVAALIYLIYKYRLKRLLELERVRTRIATDLHDDIGANLTRISLLSEVAKQKAENGNGELLSSIADIARESVSSMNDIVWAISPEHDSLLDLTRRMRRHAEEVFSQPDMDLEFSAPLDSNIQLDVGTRRDVLLIFKEAVSNAAKHSGCTKVEINFSLEHSILRLQIKDNGKGFSPDSEFDGQGLRSMTRRAESLGGKLKINSDDGTIIEFEMNLKKEISV